MYRLKKGLWENEALRYRSWNYLQKFHIQVQSDRYKQICVSPFSWVLDSNGKPAAEDTAEGFSEETIRQIREYIQRQNVARETSARAAATPPLENWQKSYENGEYLRSAEMAEEQNYSMIGGRMNNMPSKGPVHQRHARKRRKGKLPMKGRESVLKRLKEYQDELAAHRG